MCAFELEVAVVVKTYPNDAEQVAGIAGKPAVVRGAGLSRGRRGEAPGADTSAAAVARHDGLHHVGHQVGHAGVDYRLLLAFRTLQHVALPVANGGYLNRT